MKRDVEVERYCYGCGTPLSWPLPDDVVIFPVPGCEHCDIVLDVTLERVVVQMHAAHAECWPNVKLELLAILTANPPTYVPGLSAGPDG